MAQAYTPGLKVTPHLRHRARRILPIAGEVLVQNGQQVQASDVVARTALPGDVTPINLANVLSLPPGDVLDCLLVKTGDHIEVGQPLARTKGFFGRFRNEYHSKVAGDVETISEVTGQMIVRGPANPVDVLAFIPGTVVEILPGEGCVIEADVAFIQGIFGIGGEAYGELRMACNKPQQALEANAIKPDMRGQIVVGGARMSGDAIRAAIEVGASAVISGGMDDQDLREILGYDLGVAVTGSERIGTTVIVTEGFGDIAMADRTFELLKMHAGDPCSVNGATQIRAGVMRPEILVPTRTDSPAADTAGVGQLDVGRQVRLIRDPYFGLLGTVSELIAQPVVLDSGSKARVLSVKLDDGRTVVVPRANVELIEALDLDSSGQAP